MAAAEAKNVGLTLERGARPLSARRTGPGRLSEFEHGHKASLPRGLPIMSSQCFRIDPAQCRPKLISIVRCSESDKERGPPDSSPVEISRSIHFRARCRENLCNRYWKQSSTEAHGGAHGGARLCAATCFDRRRARRRFPPTSCLSPHLRQYCRPPDLSSPKFRSAG